MKTLQISVITVLAVLILFSYHVTFAQNVSSSSNQMPPGAIKTPNGGWITPLQTTENGKNLTIHYETGIPVQGNYLPPGPPPIIHMDIKANSEVYQKGDLITISGKEDNYLIQKYGNDLTLSIDNSRTRERWCCDNFQSSQEGTFYYSFKMPDIFQSQDNYNLRVSPNNSTDQYGVGVLYYAVLPNPLVQLRLGISTLDVECRVNFIHLIKSEDQSPACVRQEASDELVKRGWAQSVMVPSKRAPHIVKPLNPINLSPCETRYEGKPTSTSTVYPNGTVITTGYVPVLYMPQNSTGMICVNYTNVNQQATAQIRIFEANNLSRQADIQYYASPDNISKGNSTVVYTISTGNQRGFYGISFFCGGMPFAVGYDNQSRIITDDFPWIGQVFHCPSMTYTYKISGLHGVGIYYIKTVSHEQLSYDIQNTTITSYSMGTNSHNATFSLHIRTFDKPARFWFDYKDSTATKFVKNPGFKFGSDACNWDVTDNSQMQNTPWLRIDGIHVKENSVSIPANSNGTYTFSILAENLSDGYYGLSPVVYGATTDVSSDDAGTNYIAYNFPLVTGIGNTKILDFSGTCLR
ncbi:MAG: hypothetical protein E6K91_08495 [Thaumarchaeota archaeon]|nr:MAG: hypothetical protein E6K91_08495 [Nitrososphaerota archaeon]